MLLRALSVGLVVLSLSWESYAAAKNPDCEKEPACMTLWTRAGEFSKDGKLVEAQRMYQMAYDLRADPRLLFNIARVLHKQGLTSEAVPYYQKYIDADLEDIEQKQKARDYLEQIRKGELPIQKLPASSSPNLSPDASLNDSLIGIKPASQEHADSKSTATPVYKKWWFWTILGTAAAGGIATGVAIGVTRSGPSQVIPMDATVLRPQF